MTSYPPRPLRLDDSTYPPTSIDPISVFFDSTMPGGTALIAGAVASGRFANAEFEGFVAVRSEVILEYEQTIAELRKQLLHYKRLVAQLLGPRDAREDFEQLSAVIPINAASVRVINSIVQARIPASATFRDFDEGEL